LSPTSLLKKWPWCFDVARLASRHLGNQTDLYRVLRQALAARTDATFIQIGAHDGISYDPYREFIISSGLRGVLVEPLPFLFKKLAANYRGKSGIILENLAIGYPPGELTLWTVDPQFVRRTRNADWLSGLARTSRESLREVVRDVPGAAANLLQLQVPCVTIEHLIQRHRFHSFDLVFIDVEGYEAVILQEMDYALVGPRLVAFEHVNLGPAEQSVCARLRQEGFSLMKCRQDTVATRAGAIHLTTDGHR
jgi:FkbM family methyltransferase